MVNDLYEADVFTWSQRQAERLRRVASGERVDDVDWVHVIEEIEDLGTSAISDVTSHLYRAFARALQLAGWPDDQATRGWLREALVHLREARRRYRPSMRQQVEPLSLYSDARADTLFAMGAPPGMPLPELPEVTLEELMAADASLPDLIARLAQPMGSAGIR